MSKNTYPLKLPRSVNAAAIALAELDGVSLNQFIAAAVAKKVGTLRTAREFLNERAGRRRGAIAHRSSRAHALARSANTCRYPGSRRFTES